MTDGKTTSLDCETARHLVERYLDGDLTDDMARRVEAHLTTCPECAALAESTRRIGDVLREHGRDVADGELMARIRGALKDEAPAERPRWSASQAWPMAAAIAAVGVLSSALTFGVMRTETGDSLVTHDLLAAHVRALIQENPIQVASSNRHVVKPWFAGKVEFAPTAVDLAGNGFPLVGGRIDYVDGRRVAVAVYRRNLHWIDLFMAPSGRLPMSASARHDGYNLASWQRDGIDYVAVSDVDPADLAKLKELLTPPVGAGIPTMTETE